MSNVFLLLLLLFSDIFGMQNSRNIEIEKNEWIDCPNILNPINQENTENIRLNVWMEHKKSTRIRWAKDTKEIFHEVKISTKQAIPFIGT